MQIRQRLRIETKWSQRVGEHDPTNDFLKDCQDLTKFLHIYVYLSIAFFSIAENIPVCKHSLNDVVSCVQFHIHEPNFKNFPPVHISIHMVISVAEKDSK